MTSPRMTLQDVRDALAQAGIPAKFDTDKNAYCAAVEVFVENNLWIQIYAPRQLTLAEKGEFMTAHAKDVPSSVFVAEWNDCRENGDLVGEKVRGFRPRTPEQLIAAVNQAILPE